MKRKYILFLICSFFFGGVSAQTLEQARTLFTKGDYEKSQPVFKKYAKSHRPMVIIITGMAYVA